MQPETYDQLEHALKSEGPAWAIERLCQALRAAKDYNGLFYALLMKKRFELGVCPVPTGPSLDLPESVHAPYEQAIADAARLVGQLHLEDGNIPAAWLYYRMLNEPAPVAEALETALVADGEDCQALVEIGYHHGVNPRRGFDLVLDRYGICSAITLIGGHEFPHGPEVRTYCIQRVVRALHEELAGRLRAEIEREEGKVLETRSIPELLAGRDWLFADDQYHIDVSHLSAVVQMSIHLGPSEALNQARELAHYGQKLSPRFHYQSDPPFEDQYGDYGVYLAILAGEDIEGGLAHFRAKAEAADPETVGTYPAEVLVNLLLRLERPAEALEVARRLLAHADDRRLTCPGVAELCQRTKDYRALAEVARQQDNPVHFVAGLIAAAQG